jgi:hypothetical protein
MHFKGKLIQVPYSPTFFKFLDFCLFLSILMQPTAVGQRMLLRRRLRRHVVAVAGEDSLPQQLHFDDAD